MEATVSSAHSTPSCTCISPLPLLHRARVSPRSSRPHPRDSSAGPGSAKCLQKFLGVRPDGEHGQFTDMALAAFLNVNHQSYPHVAMPAPAFATGVEWTETHRKPLLLKLQNFLLSHPQMTEAGGKFAVVENGELDAATVSALQTMMNCVNVGDDFAAAA